MWKPRVFPDDARECQCPFVLFLHSQGGLRRGVRASGSPQLRTGKSGSFNMGHQPRGLSRISSRGRPHPEGRREGREPLPDHAGESPLLSRSGGEKGLRGSGAGTLGVPLGGTRRVGGLLGVAGRLSGTVSPFRAEQGTSLETPSRARASSCQEVGTTWFFSSCGGILMLRQGITGFLLCRPWVTQPSILLARESWGLRSSHCRAKETSSRLVSRT